jgi:hypothetical protein
VAGQFDEPSGQWAVETLLTRGEPFTALFAANDQMAFGAMLSLYLHGVRVPEDVSVVGFDDVRMSAYTTPPLATVRLPASEIGESAARRCPTDHVSHTTCANGHSICRGALHTILRPLPPNVGGRRMTSAECQCLK